jgi:hypothetical protein
MTQNLIDQHEAAINVCSEKYKNDSLVNDYEKALQTNKELIEKGLSASRGNRLQPVEDRFRISEYLLNKNH